MTPEQSAATVAHETLADTGVANDHEKGVKAFNNYFIQNINSTNQNHVFQSMELKEAENVTRFVTRLKELCHDISSHFFDGLHCA